MNNSPIKQQFKREKEIIPELKFGILHSHVGFEDGVSIVMRQLEEVIIEELGANKNNISYLVGKAKKHKANITTNKLFDFDQKINKIMQTNFEINFTEEQKKEIDEAIIKAQKAIKTFIDKNKIDVIIAHNLSHPVNFIMSVGLSKYYDEELKQGNPTPKYILWWHDSHSERIQFENPSEDVKKYLKEGIPGGNVEHIVFINSEQFKNAEEYFLSIDKVKKGFYNKIRKNNDVIYNTTDLVLNTYEDIFSTDIEKKKKQFIKDYKIEEQLSKLNVSMNKTIFCLQHTRMVKRKKIDFALKFAFEILKKAKNKNTKYEALYFLISGNNADGTKEKLIELHKKLQKEYSENNLILEFVENYKDTKTKLEFEDYPLIINNLGGITTYFSAIEGFGNNLLEVLACGFTPIIYQYPVYKSDIAKFHFRVLSCTEFSIEEKLLEETLELLENETIRKENGNRNIKLIKNHFSNPSIADKLKNAILSKRTHWRKKPINEHN